jgi:uncharacterized protein (DUF427 family)
MISPDAAAGNSLCRGGVWYGMSIRMRDVLAQAREQLRHEPIERRLRARLGGQTIVDSTRAVLLWEPRRLVPAYAVPADDIAGALRPARATTEQVAGPLHPGIAFAVHTARGEAVAIGDRDGAGFRLDDPDLAGYVALDFAAFDAWFEEDDPVVAHPRDPYHRVDVRRSSRTVTMRLGGVTVAETTRARLVFETSLPMRFYVPRDDFRVALRPSQHRTYCPYKGEASYWSFDTADQPREDLVWSYEEPLEDMPAIRGLIGFWHEQFEAVVDGAVRTHDQGEIATTLLDEFDVTS